MNGDREGESDDHSRGVGLHRLVDERADVGEAHDRLVALLDLGGPEPHEGVVFAVQRDGKYLKGASGSPMTWRGLSSPTSLVWDAQRRELWLSGADRAGHATVERLPLNLQPHVPRRTANSSGRFLLVPAPGGRLLRIDRYAESVEAVSLGSGEKVSAVSGVGTDVVFAVTHSTGAPGSRIVAIPIAAD